MDLNIDIINKKSMLTVAEAALYMGRKRESIYKLVFNRQIRYYKPSPGRLYFQREDLDDWMRQNCVEPVANEEVKDTEKEYQPVNSFYRYV